MRKNKEGFLGFSFLGFVIFFFTVATVSVCSIVVYHFVNEASNNNVVIVVFSVLATILLGALSFTFVDVYRRKKMIQKPVKEILEATQKIASGDFTVKLDHSHDYYKYDEYDLIFDNINIMTAELSKNEILKNDFISNVSHEIKTPLAAIQNYANLLKSDKLDERSRKEYLNSLSLQTKKLSDLITNILKLNKLENQKLNPEIEKFDLAELLRVTLLSYESLLEKKGIEYECEFDEVSIISSSSLVEMIINNLISNAVKFTDKGGKIFLSLTNEKQFAIIKVQDTGCGISAEVGKHIFDKFYQGDTSHATEGNGLGLALVKKVIDILGGEISVESKVGKGSIFTVKLKKEIYEAN